MDITFIHGLEIKTKIGIFEWERASEQELIIDLDIASDFKDSIKTDSINDCIDYTKIHEQVNKLAMNHSYKLLESFAQKISEIVLNHSKCKWVKVKINKPLAITEAKSIGVIIKRFKNDNK